MPARRSGTGTDGHLKAIHKAEGLVDEVEKTREALRGEARRKLGVTGLDESPVPLRQVLAMPGVSAYPLYALGILSIVDSFFGFAFGVLTPEISSGLGISRGAIAGVLALKTIALAFAPLPFAALVQKRARRAVLCVVSGVAWSLVSIFTGYVTLVWGLFFVLLLDGLTTATVGVLHVPLLVDSYPPEGRVRTLSAYTGANSLGNVIAPLLVALFTGVLGFTWRGVFVVFGFMSLAAALTTFRLRDPGFGVWDTQQIRQAVRDRHHDPKGTETTAEGLSPSDVALGFFEIVRRLFLIRTIRRLLLAWSVLGVFSIPFATFQAFFLAEKWNLGPGARGLFAAFLAGVSIASLVVFGRRGEAIFRRNPARIVQVGGVFLAVAVILILVGSISPVFAGVVVLFAAANALIAPLVPAFGITTQSVIPSHMRPHAAALSGIFVGVGGIVGAIFLGGIDTRFGVAAAVGALAVPGIAGALLLGSTSKFVAKDLDRMIDETIEDEEIQRITASKGHLPMLACRNIDYSYGQVQVLFGVNFTVDDGEMVALLGTNGAGKSTLLKAISGIGLPGGGSVRFRGADVTYLDAERRLRLGITQIPGGRAVFGPMSVAENLRLFGYSLGRDRRSLEEAMDRAFAAFPRLAERRNQKAGTLSGGEQQMLGVAKALILRPRLLLVDELSLGLAPVIVAQLLEMVRQINADGTAVVLVEQSVNIALGLVEHAYFMEKGEIRFDGSSRELLGRDDLLRAVFLEGVGKGASL